MHHHSLGQLPNKSPDQITSKYKKEEIDYWNNSLKLVRRNRSPQKPGKIWLNNKMKMDQTWNSFFLYQYPIKIRLKERLLRFKRVSIIRSVRKRNLSKSIMPERTKCFNFKVEMSPNRRKIKDKRKELAFMQNIKDNPMKQGYPNIIWHLWQTKKLQKSWQRQQNRTLLKIKAPLVVRKSHMYIYMNELCKNINKLNIFFPLIMLIKRLSIAYVK